MTRFFYLLIILGLSSCNFQVIYKERKADADISYTDELAAIRIQKVRTRLAQEFTNNLYDLLNPDYVKADPKYLLVFKIDTTTSPVLITSTGASGRNNVALNITYELKNLENAETVGSGSTSVNDNYNVDVNRYGTYTEEEYMKSNLSKLAAQNIRNSLVNDLIEDRKNPKKKDNWINERPEPEKQDESTKTEKKNITKKKPTSENQDTTQQP